jgi:hypothetical protein
MLVKFRLKTLASVTILCVLLSTLIVVSPRATVVTTAQQTALSYSHQDGTDPAVQFENQTVSAGSTSVIVSTATFSGDNNE